MERGKAEFDPRGKLKSRKELAFVSWAKRETEKISGKEVRF